MFKTIGKEVWIFDAEWVPDPQAGRRAYNLPATMVDADVVDQMWIKAGATEDKPRPFLKTILCRVVSISAIVRTAAPDGAVTLRISSLPKSDAMDSSEATIINAFLGNLGKRKPQLVGFNSINADIMILTQRALVNGLRLPDFCARPNKPWEGVDYFANGSDSNIDLQNVFGAYGKGTPSLHELATASGIPGKLGTDGQAVYDLWAAGNIRSIIQYNETDAITTYLVWLRAAHLGGHLTTEAYASEQALLESYLTGLAVDPANHHLTEYLAAWKAMRF